MIAKYNLKDARYLKVKYNFKNHIQYKLEYLSYKNLINIHNRLVKIED